MKAENGEAEEGDQEKTWQPTQYANIVRHVPSDIYYARLRIKGKLIWRSPKGCVAYWLTKLRKVCFWRGIQQFCCMGNDTTFAQVHQ